MRSTGGMRSLGCGVLLSLAALAGCGGGAKPKAAAATDSLSERQRDSILAKSRIPGANAVGKAMTAADSTSARVRATDTIQ
jgi:hypothetical protein